MSIKYKLLFEIVDAINRNYDQNVFHITIKDIKRMAKKYSDLDISDKSRGSFYVYILKELETQGFIEKRGKFYRIINPIYLLEVKVEGLITPKGETIKKIHKKKQKKIESKKFETINDNNLCQNCNRRKANPKHRHINHARDEIRFFCSKECKLNWIFEYQKYQKYQEE